MMAKQTDKPRASIGNLGLVWRHASRYRGHIAAALFFLCLSSAATLAIPYGFKRVIDRGFGSEAAGTAAVGQSFHYLLMIVVVLARGHRVPLLFRVVDRRADHRRPAPGGAEEPADASRRGFSRRTARPKSRRG